MNLYEIYNKKTDKLLARGTARECQKKLGCASIDSFYALANRSLRGINKKYRVVITKGGNTSYPVLGVDHTLKIREKEMTPIDYILDDKFDVVELLGMTALFTEDRIDDDLIPTGLYKYELSEGIDDPDVFYFDTLEKEVNSFHGGTVITAEPIDLGEDGCIYFEERSENDIPGFDGREMTLRDFIKEYGKGGSE